MRVMTWVHFFPAQSRTAGGFQCCESRYGARQKESSASWSE
jgi:hypothetical protein